MLSTNGWSWSRIFGFGIGIVGSSFWSASCVQAQITPDNTLPTNSNVKFDGKIWNITDGTRAGNNLFHSFKEFSVRTGQQAHFNNAADIQNIISRVTGLSRSEINGLIKILQGNANLFLINPNGIVFGPNASLDIGGSFVATTAESLKFADGTEFSAKAPQTTPLLTISVPTGLQFGSTAGAIVNRSQGDKIDDYTKAPVGLQVKPEKTLALIGGDVTLEGGNLKAEQGRIELGSVAGPGLVSLSAIDKGYAFGYADVTNFGDIKLTQGSFVDASGNGGGIIQVQGRNVSLTDRATIQAETTGNSTGQGSISITAPNSVTLEGMSADKNNTFISAATTGTGDAGKITINTGKLVVQDRAQIQTLTGGNGNAGDLEVNASDSVILTGNSSLNAQSQNPTNDIAKGKAGNITINTSKLTVQHGAQIQTLTQGNGNAGNLTVNASDSVELIGTSSDNTSDKTSLRSASAGSAKGSAGNTTITTGKLIVRDGAFVDTATAGDGKGGNLTVVASDSVTLSGANAKNASVLRGSTGGTGDGGDISIDTGKLIVQDGAQILTNTEGNGRGGKLTVTARKSVELIGLSKDVNTVSSLLARSQIGENGNAVGNGNGIGGEIIIKTGCLIVSGGAQVSASSVGQGTGGRVDVNASDFVELVGRGTTKNGELSRSGIFSQNVDNTAKGGDINISTGRLTVRDGAIITVNDNNTVNNAKGAGNINITAPTILLSNGFVAQAPEPDKRGGIVAEAASGNGGNITINNSDLLLLGGQSRISTTAGSPGRSGDGGIINISAPAYLVALPNQNSSITANSFGGKGGTVTIKADGILGIESLTLEQFQNQFGTTDPNQINNPNNLNYITAISFTGIPSLNGQVTIASPNTEPSRSLVNQPPPKVVDPSKIIARGCPAGDGKTGSQFIVTGRGGLPPSPDELLSTDVVWSDTRLPNTIPQQHKPKISAAKPSSKPESVAIVPATGWVFNGKGEVTLISSAPNATALNPTPVTCPRQ